MTDETRNTVEAAKLANVSVRQLNHWAACGYLRPIGGGSSGKRYRWPIGEIDLAETLGVFSHVFTQREFFAVLVESLRRGTVVEMADGDYRLVMEVRANDN